MSWNVTNSISAIKSAKPMPLMTFRYLDGISFFEKRHGDAVDEQEQHVSAVECGQRQQVHHGEVHREHRGEKKENIFKRRAEALGSLGLPCRPP